MSKGTTYYATEPDGFIHQRYQSNHDKPLFKYAVVRHPHCSRWHVSWHTERAHAQMVLGDLEKTTVDGASQFPEVKLYEVTSEGGKHDKR